ncbi:MAG: diguanylate cyclase, partial [Dokdonella sp.]|uniref:GGDEF domain-containing protein n=1 Tax=Dokdonella sp. TaxID=2291710 RepID=UPI0032675C35
MIVEARDYAGNVSGPLEMPIEVLPAWWQTKVTRLLFAFAIVLLAYALVTLRTRNLRLQRRTLEQRIAQRTAELNEANAQLRRLSYQDSLTGLANRRHLLEVLQSLCGKRPNAGVASLIFIDVDHFKSYNDQFGHPAGDMALHAVADAMRRCAPPETVVARYGGEEFACLMPETGLDEAMKVA